VDSPSTLLSAIADPACFTADDLRTTADWIVELTPGELDDLDTAIDRVRDRELPITAMHRSDLSLRNLGPKLDRVREEILHGRGLVQLRGLPVERYDPWKAAAVLFGIGLYIGDAVPQNSMGHVLGHVMSLSSSGMEVGTNRGYHIPNALPFHADSCDVVGLMCVRPARSGGEARIVSTMAIYNALLARRPDLVETLMQPFFRDRRGEIPAGKKPYYEMPVFMFSAGRLITNFQGTYIFSSQRFPELPRLTDKQLEALHTFKDLADELSFQYRYEPGDVQFLHNHVVLHSRSAFEDSTNPAEKRHMLRLWLATPDGPTLPACFIERAYLPTPTGTRPVPGVWPPGVILNAPIEPEITERGEADG
jgi:hypothetical protein